MSQTETTPEAVPDPDESNAEEGEHVTSAEIEQLAENNQQEKHQLTKDDVFGLLKNSRRREVTRYLLESDGEATLDELAEHIAAKENGISVRRLSSDQRKRVYIGLYQCHLPKMDKVGVIDYDKNRGTIEACETLEQLDPYLSENVGSKNPGIELGAAVTVGAAVLLGVLEVWPLSIVSATWWAVVSVAGLIGLAALRQYRTSQSIA